MRPLLSTHKYFLKYRWHLLGGIFFVTISNLFGIFPAQLTRHALDLVASQIDSYRLISGFKVADTVYSRLMGTVFLFGVLVLAMALLKGVFMFLMRQTIIVMSRHIEFDMKNAVYAQYQRLGMDFYQRNSTGDLMNRISEDVGRVRMYVGPAIMYSINMLVMFVLVIWAMFSVNTHLATMVLLPLPLMSLLIYVVHERINRKSEQVQSKLSDLSTFVQESLSGIRILKAFAREDRFAGEYRSLTAGYAGVSMDLVRINALFMPAMAWLVGLSTILTVFIGGMEVMAGNITLGNIAEFVIYVNMLTWPVAALGWVISIVQRASASQERINHFLDEKPVIVSGSHKPLSLRGDIRFSKVSLRYSDDREFALRDIDFHVPAGTSLGIIGRTGSGKSSIVNLLMRLSDPTDGSIAVDDVLLPEYDLKAFRSRIGYVPQDVFLFSDTVAANISFGCPHAVSQDAIEEAARQAVVLDNILGFPDGFRTEVGERGITLSGGQKQRISIARALVRNPDVLVFDDCLSAVDTWTEARILSNLQDLMKGKTTIVISHRVQSVQACDRIIVLEEGCMVEEGDHHSLIGKAGVYAQLVESQSLESNSSDSEIGNR